MRERESFERETYRVAGVHVWQKSGLWVEEHELAAADKLRQFGKVTKHKKRLALTSVARPFKETKMHELDTVESYAKSTRFSAFALLAFQGIPNTLDTCKVVGRKHRAVVAQ